jgi:hypothetical protein
MLGGAMNRFKAGDRVEVYGHHSFADGIAGTITPPPSVIVELCPPGEWDGPRRTFTTQDAKLVSYYVQFDEPHDDGSGDGPYRGAEIKYACLRLLRSR